MLLVTTDGRKAALDLRLYDPSLPDHPTSKLNQAVSTIERVWRETAPGRLTQLVFCDLSTPKETGFSVYDDVKAKLVIAGVPAADVAFIQDYDSDAAKLALARELGADAAIDVEKNDVVTSVRDATGGGAEVVVDTTPYAPQSFNHAVAIAVRRGRIIVAGLKGLRPAQDVAVDDVIYKELTIRGVLSMPVDETFRAIDIIESGRYPFEKMHTRSLPLEQAEHAIHMLAGHVPGVNPIHLAICP